MFDQTTFVDSPSVISSPESVDGRSRFDVLDGPMIDLFGLVPHRANLSPRQAKDLGLLTSGTYGRHSIGSSPSAALQRLLESKLRARMSTTGSTLFNLTWKPWVTPSEVSRFRLRASVRRTSETETTGWPTPTTRDHKDGAECANVPLNALLGRVAWQASWPTPTSALAHKGVRSTEGGIREAMRSHGPDLAAMACLASWGTPTAKTFEGNPEAAIARKVKLGIGNRATQLGHQIDYVKNSPARLTASGEMLIGSSAGTRSGGQLSPEHSRWLMGYPKEWASSAPNSADWQNWQGLILQASSAPKPTELEPFEVMETQST